MTDLVIHETFHYVVFHDGSVIKIADRQQKDLAAKWGSPALKHITIDGGIYAVSAISKILTEQEYFYEYPEKRPEPPLKTFVTRIGDREEYGKAFNPLKAAGRRKHRIESLIRGYGRGRIETIGREKWEATKQNDTLYQRMIKLLKSITQNENKSDFVEVFGKHEPDVLAQAAELFPNS